MLLVQFHLPILIHVSVVPLKHVEPAAEFFGEAEMLECWHKVVNRCSTVARIDDFLSLLKVLLQYERTVCPEN